MIVGKLTVMLGLNKTGFDTGINTVTHKTTAFKKFTDSSFKAIKNSIKVAMAGIGIIMVASTKLFSNFEKQLANISTMLSSKTMPMMSKFESGLLSMSKEFGESTNTLSKGLYDILSASIPASKAMDVLEASTIAAKAGMSDTAVSADALTTLINSFRDSTKDATYYSDIMFSAVKFGKTTFNEIAGSIGNVSTLFATLGGSAEELAGMLAILTRNGINTATATTNVKGVVSALLKPSEELTAALGGLTVQGDGFTAVMEKVASFPPQDLAKMFPNVRALTGVVIAAGELSSEVDKINNLMAEGSPAQEAFRKQTDTLAFSWSQFKETLKVTAITIGKNLAPQLKVMLGELKAWFSENQGNIVNFFSGFASTMTTLIKTAVQFKEVIIGVGVAIGTLSILNKATTAMKAFGIATSLGLGPIAAISAGIGLLVAGIIKLNQMTREYESDTELLNAAMQGTATNFEDYNEGLKIANARLQTLKDRQQQASDTVGTLYQVQSQQAAIQDALHQKNIENAEKDIALIQLNQERFVEAKRLEQEASAAAASAEMEAIMAAAQASAEELSATQTAIAAEQQRQDQIEAVREALAEAAMTDEQRIEAEKTRLQELGFTNKEIVDYLQVLYADYYEELIEKEKEKNASWLDDARSLQIALNNIREERKEDEQTFNEWLKESWTGVMDMMVSTAKSVATSITSIWGYAADKQIKSVEKQYDVMTDEEKKYAAFMEAQRIEELTEEEKLAEAAADSRIAADKREAAEILKIKRDLAKKEKKVRIAVAVIDTAASIIRALVDPGGFAGVAMSIAAGITGAAQIAMIRKQPLPTLIGGGLNNIRQSGQFKGNPGIDTNLALLTNDEYIMPPQQTRDNFNMLEAMRSGEFNQSFMPTIQAVPVNIYLDSNKVGEGMLDFITDNSDSGSLRINPKAIRAS